MTTTTIKGPALTPERCPITAKVGPKRHLVQLRQCTLPAGHDPETTPHRFLDKPGDSLEPRQVLGPGLKTRNE
jgi:hypothetical protein